MLAARARRERQDQCQRPVERSETHHATALGLMGFASLYPSYGIIPLSGKHDGICLRFALPPMTPCGMIAPKISEAAGNAA